ncbi:unnamed protein product [Parascedosporium putredinis]|uniref:Alpha/beta-hydrolase n=1 Tax=Parascedosporium putredinis TaxID=1442378 RepID=A0A9P1H650_9PEZI|nr:unnamed protein product [Parascedosporium putredinis]CAI7997300.1 unnamed protein product [Parascedosporium putredinis]
MPPLGSGAFEDATVQGDSYNAGGVVTVNGFVMNVPENLLVQFPAAWVPWKEFVANKADFLGFETLVIGNSINGIPRVAQIQLYDMKIQNGPTVRINDPNGVFSVGYTGAPLMTADDVSPSITSFSGFPMCIPRNTTDPLCPMSNRPFNGPGTFTAPDPLVMSPFLAGDFITITGFRKGNEIIASSIVAENVMINTIGDLAYFIGFVSNPRATVALYAMDIDPCTGETTDRLIAALGLRGGRNVQNKFEYRNEILSRYTREYKVITEINGVPKTRVTKNGLVMGEYVQPVNVWVPGEQDVPGPEPAADATSAVEEGAPGASDTPAATVEKRGSFGRWYSRTKNEAESDAENADTTDSPVFKEPPQPARVDLSKSRRRPARSHIHMGSRWRSAASRLPVSYVLDGNSDFLTVSETVRRTSRMPDATGITPSIVVAVGYPNTTDYNIVRRGYDFTRRGPVDSDLDDNGFVYGGQPAFMRFIERQLVPHIGAHYPAHINSRTLIGHSLGGYCALEFLAWKPSVFKGYIILSPSIWWDKPGLWERLLHPRLGEFVNAHRGKGSATNVIMKWSHVFGSGLVWIQSAHAAAAPCCHNAVCANAISEAEFGTGIEDCSSALALTVTAAQSEVQPITVATETVFFTVHETASADPVIVTVTVTTQGVQPVKRDGPVESQVPQYANHACKSWKKYTAACECLGVKPTTVTVDAETVTITEDLTTTLTSDSFVTATVTITETVPETALASHTEVAFVTVTPTQTTTLIITEPVCTPRGGPCRLERPDLCCNLICFGNNGNPYCG